MLRKLRIFLRSLRRRLELSRYDDFTIAEFFRRQGARIGRDNRILIRSLGSEPWLISIGNHCTISTAVNLLTHDGATWVFTDEMPSLQSFGPIRILDNCFIGSGAIILPGVRIGPNSVVGAGSIVTRDVPASTVVAGCPARTICDLAAYKRKATATWAAQRPPGYMDGLKDGHSYAPSEVQAQKVAGSALLRRHLERLFFEADQPDRQESHDSH